MNDYEEMKEELTRVSEEHCDGNPPRVNDMNKYGKFSHGKYVYHFDRWNDALREFGFEVNVEKKRKYNLSQGELKEEIIEVYNEIGKPPTMGEFEENSGLNRKRYIREFGTWNKALRECGFDVRGEVNISKERLKQNFEKIVEENGELPTVNQYRDMDTEFSYTVYQRSFGSWKKAVEEMGYEPYETLSGEEHPRWKGGYKYYYGASWWKQQSKVWERDEYRCRVCHSRQENKKPDVHHIKPATEWNIDEEHEEMNSLDNLVSLCLSCHKKFEGKWRECSVDEFVRNAKEEIK